ncbi:MAG: PDZ domain-containing protein [Anaerolineaceae bacterium]|nr:PDZ domain-containing protein [Anaerolineaceae bacterium]
MLLIIVSLLIALSILVFVHELGHYLVAKRFGVVVEEFGFGYPPRLLAFWHTKGKVVIDGQEIIIPRDFRLPEELESGSLVTYETSTDGKGRGILTHIEKVEPGVELGRAGRVEMLDPGTLFSLNAIPFGGFAKMLGEEDPSSPGSLASKGKLPRILVLAAGGGMNLLAAAVFFALAFAVGAPAVADPENAMVSMVAPGSPAEEAGLQAGDVIVRAGDTEILNITTLQQYTNEHLGEPVMLAVERDGEVLEVQVVPRAEPPPEEGPIGIGLSPRTTIKSYPWYEALWMGARQTVTLTGFIFTVPVQLIQGLIPAEMARPVGPVGVGQLVGDAVQYSIDTGWWFPVMQLMGSLSVALAVTNLLPLPALDGGRILFVFVEAIRGKRVDPSKEGLVHLIGMILLVALMLFITWQDVINPVPSVDWGSFF